MTDRRENRPAAWTWTLAAACGVTLGSIDAAVDLAVRSDVSASPLSAWTCLGVSAALGALGFLALWLLLRPLRNRPDVSASALSLAVAAAVGTLALPALLACYRALDPQWSSLAFAVPAAAVVGAGVYLLARPFASGPRGDVALGLFACAVAVSAAAGAGFFALRQRGFLDGAPLALAGLALSGVIVAAAARHAWVARELSPARNLVSVLFAAALALGLLHATPTIEGPPGKGAVQGQRKPRQVVLIVVDTLRADYLSCYRADRGPTPVIDSIAAQSLFFTQPRSSAPWTFPSVSSILTGLAPSVHLGLRPFDALPEQVETLAQRLSKEGMLTAAFVRNPALRGYTQIDRGFDEYHFQREPHPPSALAEIFLRVIAPETYLPQVGADVQTRRVSRWIAEHKDRDFFLWVHYFDPHMAYNPPREFQPEGTPPREVGRNFTDAARVRGGFMNPDAADRAWIAKLYEGEVRATDRGLAGLFEELKRSGIYDDALVVFTADHGDELWEHEGFEHGHAMYDEVLGVPLFFKLPGGVLAQRVEEPVSNQSIVPTVLEVLSLPYDPARLSAPPLVRRSQPGAPLELAAEPRTLVSSGILYFEARTAVVFDGFKYIQFHVSNRVELYDLTVDPGEKVNLAQERPDLVSKGARLLEQHLAEAQAQRQLLGIDQAQRRDLDEDTQRDLRSLGYVK